MTGEMERPKDRGTWDCNEWADFAEDLEWRIAAVTSVCGCHLSAHTCATCLILRGETPNEETK